MICRNHVDVFEGVRRCSRCGGTFCPDCLVDIQGRPYCATCKGEQLLDVRSGVDRTVLSYGGIGSRFGAMFLDNLIVTLPGIVLMMVFIFSTVSQGKQPNPLINLIGIPFMFINLVYEGLMMQYKNGQTLGKMALKLRVVRADGSPITPGQAWGRAAMRMVFASCISIVDYIPAFFTPEKTTLHDMVAGTRVVQDY